LLLSCCKYAANTVRRIARRSVGGMRVNPEEQRTAVPVVFHTKAAPLGFDPGGALRFLRYLQRAPENTSNRSVVVLSDFFSKFFGSVFAGDHNRKDQLWTKLRDGVNDSLFRAVIKTVSKAIC
jgi:hypothetical protein